MVALLREFPYVLDLFMVISQKLGVLIVKTRHQLSVSDDSVFAPSLFFEMSKVILFQSRQIRVR